MAYYSLKKLYEIFKQKHGQPVGYTSAYSAFKGNVKKFLKRNGLLDDITLQLHDRDILLEDRFTAVIEGKRKQSKKWAMVLAAPLSSYLKYSELEFEGEKNEGGHRNENDPDMESNLGRDSDNVSNSDNDAECDGVKNRVPITLGELAPDNGFVDAKKLHAFLQVRTRFGEWHKKRTDEYSEFSEGIDYYCVDPTAADRKHGQFVGKDYMYSIDMSKDLCMVEKTERGREARKYFRECERIAKEKTKRLTPAQLFAQQAQVNLDFEKRFEQVETKTKTTVIEVTNVKKDVEKLENRTDQNEEKIDDIKKSMETVNGVEGVPKGCLRNREIGEKPMNAGFNYNVLVRYAKSVGHPEEKYFITKAGDNGQTHTYWKSALVDNEDIKTLGPRLVANSVYLKTCSKIHKFHYPKLDMGFEVRRDVNGWIESIIKDKPKKLVSVKEEEKF